MTHPDIQAVLDGRERWTVIQGDCLDVMRGLPGGCVDAVVTDPPYGLDFKGAEWDSFIPHWTAEARRIAPVVVFTTAPTTLWDYPRPDWVGCWYRDAASSRSTLGGGFNHWTPLVIYGKPRFPVDSIKLHAIASAYPRGFPHPSPKPIALMRWMVSNAIGEGAIVADPFCGSGSTGVAAILEGHRFIGIEREASYCTIARRRIADAAAQGNLFNGANA